ncbi:MAG: proprotein convertase P-domain-containing protein [Phaeodactylibacter sp.]|nr:proprotein convertase P-domain-containing protein [Phaeodactylibacter sp.]MCB9264727.1 proprotein convertase P-domain-containing protein [Lewinellaceae bacterium]MCB9287777.1 proprotein convertase P-domain-containing protein [Lewinellaceae bacterium]
MKPFALSVGYPLIRGGNRLDISKVPDEFTIRVLPGADEEGLSRAVGGRLQNHLPEQRLSVISLGQAGLDEAMSRVRSSREVAFASHVYTIGNDPIGRFYLTDELTVQFATPLSLSDREQLMGREGLAVAREIKGLEGGYVYRLSADARSNPLKLAQQLNEWPEVRYCEANVAIPCLHYYEPSDTLFKHQWYLHHDGGMQLAEGAHIDVARAWDISRGKRSVIVAVADDFIDVSHRDLSGPGKAVAPLSLKNQGEAPRPGAWENHGTACAGLAVAEENDWGIVGVAPGCALMPIHTSGTLDDNAVELLFGWAVEKGAAVISNSWGVASANFPLSVRQHIAIQRAAREGRSGKGCVICFAAGNANRPINGTVDERGWPGGRLEGPTRWYNGFAAHPDVIAVAACTSLNKKAGYSNWGAEISVCAPSNNTHPTIGPGPTYPKVSAPFPGRAVYTTDRSGREGYDHSDYTAAFGGTSSSCPLVAGVAALMLSVNPALTAAEVKKILESTADKIQDNSIDPQLGNALGSYDENGHSSWFGFGKVNAFRAVVQAGGEEGRVMGSFKGRSAPALQVSDNSYAGVSDAIKVEEQGVVSNIEVEVQITHSYIGDLKVSLVAPSGRLALLHDKAGGGKNRIRRAYTFANTPALRGLAGELTAGEWVLKVQDIAPRDTGRLEEWALSLAFGPVRTLILEDHPAMAIPDDQPFGIRRVIEVEADSVVKKVAVSLDISHPFIGDLEVSLVSPQGREAVLHSRKGGAGNDISATYDSQDVPALQALAGQAANGGWALKVRDLAFRDVGVLNAWRLELVVEGEA